MSLLKATLRCGCASAVILVACFAHAQDLPLDDAVGTPDFGLIDDRPPTTRRISPSSQPTTAATRRTGQEARRETPPTPNSRLDLMARVHSDTTFTVYRRRPDNSDWDEGSPFDRNAALSILAAMAKAVPWNGRSHASAYSQWDTQTPPLKISLAWCKDITDKNQRDTQSVHMCSGSWLFWYGDSVYRLPREGHDLIESIFPERANVPQDAKARGEGAAVKVR